LLAGLFVALGVGLATTDFSFRLDGALGSSVASIAALMGAGHIARQTSFARQAHALTAIAQLMILFLLAPALTHIVASASFPFVDGPLAAIDRLLGLDWLEYFQFIYDRPALVPYLYLGYAMITWPIIVIPTLLGFAGYVDHLNRFTLACVLTVVMTVAISIFVPALGTYHHYGVSPDFGVLRPSGYLVQIEQLPRLRDGTLRVLQVGSLGGVIAFPSFHAAAAVLSLWGLWRLWWARPLATIANGGMLLATPIIGGHHFIDVLAGVAVAVLAIHAADRIGSRERAVESEQKLAGPIFWAVMAVFSRTGGPSAEWISPERPGDLP
jgi:hypothetical protein